MSPRNPPSKRGSEHKKAITEIAPPETVTQQMLAEIQQMKSDLQLLQHRIHEATNQLRAILDHGGEVESGPLHIVRRRGGNIDIY